MRTYVIVEAPTNLGLHPGGVERLSAALLAASFADRVLGPQKRTQVNGSELHRMDSSYPLRYAQKCAFKQASASGQIRG